MTNKTTTELLGWVFLISSFITDYGINIIVASIFFAANYIIEEIQKLNRK